MSFTERLVNVTFTLGSNPTTGVQRTFTESGTNSVVLFGLRLSSKITKAGGNAMGTAELTVYGMTLSLMNQLSTLGFNPIIIGFNSVTIEAGDVDGTMSSVFTGTIYAAWMDAASAPDVAFRVSAHTGAYQAVAPAAPSSFTGQADVATIMSGLASAMGFQFENNGVSKTLSTPYFWGSARAQVKACADAAEINWVLDDTTLAIWLQGAARQGSGQTPLLSATTGMVGYPGYTSKGVLVKSEFNPAITFGGQIQIDTGGELPPAEGLWNVFLLDHDLDTMNPNGPWFSTVQAARPGSAVSSPGVSAIPD